MISRLSILQLGPFTIRLTWVITLLSFLAGFLIYFLLMENKKDDRKQINTVFTNAVFIFIAIWKLSPLLFRFKTIISSPILLLYLPGGRYGTITAVVTTAAYFLLAFRKRQLSFRLYMPKIGTGIASALIISLISIFIVLPGAPRQSAAAPPETGSGIGQLAQDFELKDLAGKPVTLSSLRGKTVILNFWATWCPPCRAEIPEMVRFYREEARQSNMEILAVNLTASEPNIEQIQSFVLKENMTFPVVLDVKNIAEKLYHVQSIPTTYIINGQGIIINKKTGAMSLDWIRKQVR